MILILFIFVALGVFIWVKRQFVRQQDLILLRQALSMNWLGNGTDTSDGYRNTRVKRGDNIAIIKYATKNVLLVKPIHIEPFDDFIQLEHWLAGQNRDERDYYRCIEAFVKEHGFETDLLHVQGTDQAFSLLSFEIYQLGYAKPESFKVVAALILEALRIYQNIDRFEALSFLVDIRRDLGGSEIDLKKYF